MPFLPRRLTGFLRRHHDAAIRVGVLLVTAAVCVPLLATVPDSRPYGATFLAWTIAFALRLWRWLPSERAHVRRAAHRLADARMRQRGVGKVLMPYTHTSRTSTSTLTATAASSMPLVPRRSRERLCKGDACAMEEAPVTAAPAGAAAATAFAANASARRPLFSLADNDSTGVVAAPRRPAITGLGDGTVASYTASPLVELLPVDTGLSTSALMSSVEFLSRTRPSAPAVEPFALALYYARGTGAAAPSGSESETRSGGRDNATDVPRHRYEPFTHVSHAARSDGRSPESGYASENEDAGNSSAVFSSVGSAASPASPASCGTQGYSGMGDAEVSVPSTPHVHPPPSPQPQRSALVRSEQTQPSADEFEWPPAAASLRRGAAAPPDVSLPSAPRISVTSSTLRLQRLAPPVSRRDPHVP